MPEVRFLNVESGVHKIGLVRVIRSYTGLGLREGKQVVDELLVGQQPVVTIPSAIGALNLVVEARSCGATAEIINEKNISELNN